MKFLEEYRVREGIIIRKHHYKYGKGWIYGSDLEKGSYKKIDKSFVQLTKDIETKSCGKDYLFKEGSYLDKYNGSPVTYEKDRKVEVCFAGGKIVGSKTELKNILENIIKGLEEE